MAEDTAKTYYQSYTCSCTKKCYQKCNHNSISSTFFHPIQSFAPNNTDLHACIAIHVLNELGYPVPMDVQVIGFDGTRKFYPSQEYIVSTIKQPLPELAKKCVDMLLDEDNYPFPTSTLLPVTYEYGGTTIG